MITTLVTDVKGVKTFFFNETTMNYIVKIAHVLKYSHGRCVVGAFGEILHEGSILTRHRAVLSFILHKSTFLHFVHHGTHFYEKYINNDDRKKCVDDD